MAEIKDNFKDEDPLIQRREDNSDIIDLMVRETLIEDVTPESVAKMERTMEIKEISMRFGEKPRGIETSHGNPGNPSSASAVRAYIDQ